MFDGLVEKLYLGIKYLNSINIDESKIIIGWNKEDTKVKMSNIKQIITEYWNWSLFYGYKRWSKIPNMKLIPNLLKNILIWNKLVVIKNF